MALTRCQSILTSRLLDMAAEEFSNHGCNDAPDELFEDMSEDDKSALADGYNAWNVGREIDSCDDDYIPFRRIGDNSWMAYMAHVIGVKK